MNNIFQVGDQKKHAFVVNKDDIAAFGGQVVHQVCSTFVLAREIEWSARLFVLDIKEEDEEAIGTMLAIEHKSPALVNEQVFVIAKIQSWRDNELICSIEVKVENRIIAVGKTGQQILKKSKLKKLFEAVNKHGEKRE